MLHGVRGAGQCRFIEQIALVHPCKFHQEIRIVHSFLHHYFKHFHVYRRRKRKKDAECISVRTSRLTILLRAASTARLIINDRAAPVEFKVAAIEQHLLQHLARPLHP